jgi:hypothetical protein
VLWTSGSTLSMPSRTIQSSRKAGIASIGLVVNAFLTLSTASAVTCTGACLRRLHAPDHVLNADAQSISFVLAFLLWQSQQYSLTARQIGHDGLRVNASSTEVWSRRLRCPGINA